MTGRALVTAVLIVTSDGVGMLRAAHIAPPGEYLRRRAG